MNSHLSVASEHLLAPGNKIHTFDARAVKEIKHERAQSGPCMWTSLSHKVDVESFEWDLFLSTVDWSSTKVGQLLIEFHPQLGRRVGQLS
jgi:hypothetical protein